MRIFSINNTLSFFLAILFASKISCQTKIKDLKNLNGYKYIYLAPSKYEKVKYKSYFFNFNSSLKSKLISRGFNVIENKSVDSISNCDIATCFLVFSPTKLYIKFHNCSNDLIFYSRATFEPIVSNKQGWNTAFKNALAYLNAIRYNYDSSKKPDWKSNGSGILISNDGYIATNHHVIENDTEIGVEINNNEYIAQVISVDKTNDLAILKINLDSNKLPPIPHNFNTRSVDIGTEVFALGYPKALTLMGKDIKFTDGRISSKTGFQGDITSYQTTTPIQPGNSGGPLFDHKGNLLGINSAKIVSDDVEGVSYTIKTSYLLNLIDVLPESIPIPNSTWVGSKPLTDQIKILSNYVVLVKVK